VGVVVRALHALSPPAWPRAIHFTGATAALPVLRVCLSSGDHAEPPSPPRFTYTCAYEGRGAWKDAGHGCRPSAAEGPACPHAGPSRYGLLQAPWQRKLRSSRSLGEALCLLLSAAAGQNLTRQSDCLATVPGRSPAAYEVRSGITDEANRLLGHC
jgi:hypothetical protein